MKATVLMTASAVFMLVVGLVLTFLPQETLVYFLIEPVALLVIALQLTGALYLGFAMLNWMARSNLVGGIYSRPVAAGNFLHFVVAAITLVKAVLGGFGGRVAIAAALFYVVFAVWFGLVLYTHPGKASNQ